MKYLNLFHIAKRALKLNALGLFVAVIYENGPLTTSVQGSVVTITRENQYLMQIDFDKDTISFYDFDAFFVPSWTSTVIDVL